MVSIIIPCYNQAHFLPEAIESVLAQTHPHIETVVVDDGSPDNTAEIARGYPFVRCVCQKNKGLSAARNAGFQASCGEYVMFLDADDCLTPGAVEAHLRCFAEHPDAGFVVGSIDHMARDGSYKGSPRWKIEADQYEELLKVNHVANTIAVMFQCSALQSIGQFDKTCAAGADYDLLLRAARSFPGALHPNVVAHYRRHPANMSRSGVLMLPTMLGIMRAQRRCVKGDPRLEAACRRGENYWRDHYGAVTAREVLTHLKHLDLFQAARAFAVLIRYVRARLMLLPWKYRRHIMSSIRRAELPTVF